jgi:outer membrane receptor for ferrienterochelin and colicins
MPKINEISAATTRSFDLNTPLDADQRGNPNLKPEKSINFEAAIERYLPKQAGVLSANAYVRKTQDFTERRVELLEIADGISRWVDRPYNEGDALHWGLELDGKLNTDDWAWSGGTIRSHLTLPEARVDDRRLGQKRTARDTPHYIWSLGFDQKLPAWQSSFGMNLQMSGRSETVIPNEQSAFTRSRALLDAYWLVKLTPKMNLRITGQNLLGEDIIKSNRFTSGSNNWQYNSDEYVFRTLMVMIEATL